MHPAASFAFLCALAQCKSVVEKHTVMLSETKHLAASRGPARSFAALRMTGRRYLWVTLCE